MSDIFKNENRQQSDLDSADTARTERCGSRRQRPAGHYCPACACLMLSSERRPVRLEPCGHPICGRCAAPPGGSVACPTCRVSAVSGCPETGLHAAVVNFSSLLGAADNLKNAANNVSNWDYDALVLDGKTEPMRSSVTRETRLSESSKDHQTIISSSNNHAPKGQSPPDNLQSRWSQQLDMVSGRMCSLESTLAQLRDELEQLNGELSSELARERQVKQVEVDAREKMEHLQDELRRLGEQRAASCDSQVFVEAKIEAKKVAIQMTLAAQNNLSMELSKMQSLCCGHHL